MGLIPEDIAPTPVLVEDTPYGVVQWSYTTPQTPNTVEGALDNAVFAEILTQIVAHRPLAAYFFRGGITWSLEPQDADLPTMVTTLIQTLETALLAKSQGIVATWPDRISGSYRHPEPEILPLPWLNDYLARQVILPILGWSLCRWADYHSLTITLEGPPQLGLPMLHSYDRHALKVASPWLRLTLNLLGQGATVGDQDPELVVEGLAFHADSPHIALARRITLEGFGTLPYLVTQDPAKTGEHPLLIVAADPMGCIQQLHQDPLWVNLIAHGLYQSSDLYEYLLEGVEEDYLNRAQLTEELTLQILTAFAPHRAAAYQRDCTLKALEDTALTVQDRVAHLLFELEDLRLPRGKTQLKRLKTMRGWLEELRELLKTTQKN